MLATLAAVGGTADSPAARSGSQAASIAAGGLQTCAVLAGAVECWGGNGSGQLGDGTTTDRSRPVAVSGLTSGVQALSARQHTCALLSGNGVKCWGGNASGQLGDGTTTNRVRPVTVSGLASGVLAIAAGGAHTCAVLSSGGVKCWGANGNGQLGDGTKTARKTPVEVSGLASGVKALAAGDGHTCALLSGGGVECWGGNDSGQLGDGTTTDRSSPIPVSGLASGAQAISAGFEDTCALLSGGGVTCWGANDYGQLGDGTNANRHSPAGVSGLGSGVQAIAAGGAHTCALLSGGGVRCWGRNSEGQLGDSTKTARNAPVPVSGLASGVQAISGGDTHTCALLSGGGANCWGGNGNGQLGDGTTTDRSGPVSVIGLGGQSCVVPNVKGRTLRAAETAITRAHCKTGKVRSAYSVIVRKGQVISQQPRPGTSLKSGGEVGLVLSRGKRGRA